MHAFGCDMQIRASSCVFVVTTLTMHRLLLPTSSQLDDSNIISVTAGWGRHLDGNRTHLVLRKTEVQLFTSFPLISDGVTDSAMNYSVPIMILSFLVKASCALCGM